MNKQPTTSACCQLRLKGKRRRNHEDGFSGEGGNNDLVAPQQKSPDLPEANTIAYVPPQNEAFKGVEIGLAGGEQNAPTSTSTAYLQHSIP